jgi:hypothetical protein
MRRAVDILRFVIISPELLSTAVLLLLYAIWPAPFHYLGDRIVAAGDTSSNLYVWVATGTLVGAVPAGLRILFPHSKNDVLIASPVYSQLRNRVLFAWLLVILACLGGVVSASFGRDLDRAFLGLAYSITTVAGWIAVMTLVVAAVVLRAVIESAER